MAKNSLSSKIILSSLTVVVLLGIVALSTGARNSTAKPADKPVAEAAKAEAAAPAAEVKADATKTETNTEAKADAAVAKEPTAEEIASYMEAYGWVVGQQAGFEMGFAPAEKEALLKGIGRAANGEKAPENMKAIFPKMQEYLSAKEKAYRAKMMEKMAEEAKVHAAEGAKYLEQISKEAGVQKSASGLYYKISAAGSSTKPTTEDVVSIHYTGKLIDGTVFDSSIERGEPVDLPLYGVIPGFSEGLQLIGEGGKATLYIPSELGYGNQAAGPIPAGSTLVFDVELLKIQPKPVAPEEAASKAPVASEAKDAAEVKDEPKK